MPCSCCPVLLRNNAYFKYLVTRDGVHHVEKRFTLVQSTFVPRLELLLVHGLSLWCCVGLNHMEGLLTGEVTSSMAWLQLPQRPKVDLHRYDSVHAVRFDMI